MRTQILAMGAAALMLTAIATAAAAGEPSESQQFADRIQPKVERLLRAAGIGPQTQAVSVRATVRPDGHVTGLQVLRSSGAAETDRAVISALQQVLVSHAPIGLLDGAVTLNVGEGIGLQAQGR